MTKRSDDEKVLLFFYHDFFSAIEDHIKLYGSITAYQYGRILTNVEFRQWKKKYDELYPKDEKIHTHSSNDVGGNKNDK